MNPQTYTVEKGDSLWGISRHFGVDIHDLARLNNLSGDQINHLSIGQELILPGQPGNEPDTELTVRLLDLAYQPLANAKIKLEADQKTTEYTTNGEGKTQVILIHDRSYGLKVHYRERDGRYTLIANHKTLPMGRKTLTLTSRKMVVEGVTVPKDRSERMSTQDVRDQLKHDHAPLVIKPRAQETSKPASTTANAPTATLAPAPTPSKQAPQPPVNSAPPSQKVPAIPPVAKPPAPKPAQVLTRTEGGTPVHAVAPLFAGDNLKLAPANECYRKHIIEMAKKYSLTPQALAATIEIEALKTPDGYWKPDSAAKGTSALGLTQFLPDAWKEVCAYKGTAMNQLLRKQYTYEDYKAEKHVLSGCTKRLEPTKKGKTQTVTKWEEVPDEKGYLDWRKDWQCAIEAAGAYIAINLDRLKKNGINTDKLTPEDKAKVAYLAHHEGAEGARDIIMGTLAEAKAKQNLASNVNYKTKKGVLVDVAATLIADFDWIAADAYTYWLYELIDNSMVFPHFMVQIDKAAKPHSLSEIAVLLGGKAGPELSVGARKRREEEARKKAPHRKAASTVSNKPATPGQQSAKPAVTTANAASTPASASTPPAGGKNASAWHDPLEFDALRTANLASIKGATFGMVRLDAKGNRKAHQGIDLVATPGANIYAVAPATVLAISEDFDATGDASFGAWIALAVNVNDLPEPQRNYYLSVRPDDKEVYFFYAHLSRIDVDKPNKKKLITVNAGDVIGATGCSGNACKMTTIEKGAHLHFEARHEKTIKGKTGLKYRVDPLPFLNAYPNIKSILDKFDAEQKIKMEKKATEKPKNKNPKNKQ